MSKSRPVPSVPRSARTPEGDVLAKAAAVGAGLVTPRQLFEAFLANDSLDALTEALARSRDARHPDSASYVRLVDSVAAALPGDVRGVVGRLEAVWLTRMACASEVGFLAGLTAGRAGR